MIENRLSSLFLGSFSVLIISRLYYKHEPVGFGGLLERFLETGSLEYKKEERNKTITNEENQLAVLLTLARL